VNRCGREPEPIAIGVAFTVSDGFRGRADLVDACLKAFSSSAWNRPLRYLSLKRNPERPRPRRGGVIPAAERVAVAREMLVHPDIYSVEFATSPLMLKAYGVLEVETQPPVGDPDMRCMGMQWVGADLDRQDSWVCAMLEFAASVDVVQGVFPIMNGTATHSEVSFVSFKVDGQLRHPFPGEFRRMLKAQYELGTKYVRFPRWGTIYPHAHVEKLGGVERIREVVRPAVIRELGPNAVYVQLTESVATSLTEEALEKQRVFTELAAPVLPPPIPGEPEEGPNLRWLLESAKTLGQEVDLTPRKRKKRKKPAAAVVAAPPASPESSEDSGDDDLPKPEPFF
jgi:hypothetical protein